MQKIEPVLIFTEIKNALVIMSMLITLASFTSTQRVFGAELTIGTVSVCEEDVSAGLNKNKGNWQATEFAKKTYIFKKVPLEGALERSSLSLCPADFLGEKDSYWENGVPKMLNRCYQFKTTKKANPFERGCYEVYAKDGDLINITCEWGFIFHPEKEFFRFPNHAIFQSGGEYVPTSFGVAHGTCSKM